MQPGLRTTEKVILACAPFSCVSFVWEELLVDRVKNYYVGHVGAVRQMTRMAAKDSDDQPDCRFIA